MTELQKQHCIILSRSFINQFIMDRQLKKKDHSILFELNKKLANLIKTISKSQADLENKTKASAEFVMDKLQKYISSIVKDPKASEIEGNNLVFGLSFIFLLIEHNVFKGSQSLYFKRVSNELYDMCERYDRSNIAIKNANRLISMYDDEVHCR